MSGDLLIDEGVERPGPGMAPTAFRIWRAGVNQTDIGPVNLTQRALERLLTAQEQKGVRYSFDLNHASLNVNAPPANQVAIGDHRLEGRKGELWAANCQFSDWARSEIEKKPVPGLRHYSPAYDVDENTREPTRYVNCALTPNPATWNATALAAAKGTSMDPEKDKPPGDTAAGDKGPSVDVSAIVAGLHKLMTETTDEAQREMYRTALAALMPKKESETAAENEEEPPGSARDGGSAAKTAAKATSRAPEATTSAIPPELMKVLGTITKTVEGLKARIDAKDTTEQQQRAAAETTERTQLASVKGLALPIVTAIKDPTTPIATARILASAAGPISLASLSTSSVQGTQGNEERAVAQLPAEQASVMAAQMGMRPIGSQAPHVDGMGQLVVPCETPSQVRARLAQKAAVTK